MARKKREMPNFEGFLQSHKKWHMGRWSKWKAGGWKNAKGNLRGPGGIISYIKTKYPSAWSDWQKFRKEHKSEGRKPLPQPVKRKPRATKKLPGTLEERRKRGRRRTKRRKRR